MGGPEQEQGVSVGPELGGEVLGQGGKVRKSC